VPPVRRRLARIAGARQLRRSSCDRRRLPRCLLDPRHLSRTSPPSLPPTRSPTASPRPQVG